MSLAKEQAAESRVVREDSLGRARRSGLAIRAVVFGAVGALASGCTALIDTDRQQCDVVEDCTKQLGDELNFLNNPLTFTCEAHVCREVKQCADNAGCIGMAGKPICESGYCVACNVNTDCASPTATCVANVCEDLKWGCLNEPDNRPVPADGKSVLTGQLFNPVSEDGKVTDLSVRVCRPSTVDAACTNPYPGTTGTYDPATGLFTVTGVPQGEQFFAQLTPAASAVMLTPRDYYTNRPPRGEERIPDVINIVPLATVLSVAKSNDVDVDPKAALVQVRVFDCQGALAEGVSIEISGQQMNKDLPYPLATSYSREDKVLDFNTLDRTTKLGFGGFLNVLPNVKTDVTTFIKTADGRRYDLKSYPIVPQSARSSQLDLYPRTFTAQ